MHSNLTSHFSKVCNPLMTPKYEEGGGRGGVSGGGEKEEEEKEEEKGDTNGDSLELEHGQAPVASPLRKLSYSPPAAPPEAFSCGELHFSILIIFFRVLFNDDHHFISLILITNALFQLHSISHLLHFRVKYLEILHC